MTTDPDAPQRPVLATLCCAGMLPAAAFTAMLGWSASAWYIPAFTLAVLAVLLWLGRGLALVRTAARMNLASGALLVLVLWLGEGLGHAKLDISGVAFLVHLVCGGPLMAVAGLPVLAASARWRDA